VQVLPGVRHPEVVNDQPRLIADSFVVPDEALDLVPGPLRDPSMSVSGCHRPSPPDCGFPT
jgi:hypothetical protein